MFEVICNDSALKRIGTLVMASCSTARNLGPGKSCFNVRDISTFCLGIAQSLRAVDEEGKVD